MDPAAESGGNPSPTPAPTPPAPPVPPPGQQPTPPPGESPTVPVSFAEYQRLRGIESKLSQIESERIANEQAARRKDEEHLAEKGKWQEALKSREDRLNADIQAAQDRYLRLEKEVFDERRENVLSRTLASIPLRENAESHVRALLAPKLETVRDPNTGQLVVRDRLTGQPAEAAIRAALSAPEFALFLQPARPGTAGQANWGPRSAPTPQQPTRPPSYEETVYESWNSRRQQLEDDGMTGFGFRRPGSYDPGRPVN